MAEGNAGPTTALVRILRADDGLYQAVGVGVLVPPNHVLTCAHVVNDALGHSQSAADHPATPIWFDMPLLPGSMPHRAHVSIWYPVRETSAPDDPEDIAVLELDTAHALPARALPASFATLSPDAFFGRAVWVCGFPAGMDEGDWVEGRCLGSTARGWVQIKFDAGRQRTVAPGFSGAAVWDQQHHTVLGMIVSIDSRAGEISASMIPVTTLAKAWLTLNSRPLHHTPAQPVRPQPAADVRYSGKIKLAFCQRLGDSWQPILTSPITSRLVSSAATNAVPSGHGSITAAGLVNCQTL